MLELLLPNGAVAQLGARLNGIQKVVGSIPISSTENPKSAKISGFLVLGLFCHIFNETIALAISKLALILASDTLPESKN